MSLDRGAWSIGLLVLSPFDRHAIAVVHLRAADGDLFPRGLPAKLEQRRIPLEIVPMCRPLEQRADGRLRVGLDADTATVDLEVERFLAVCRPDDLSRRTHDVTREERPVAFTDAARDALQADAFVPRSAAHPAQAPPRVTRLQSRRERSRRHRDGRRQVERGGRQGRRGDQGRGRRSRRELRLGRFRPGCPFAQRGCNGVITWEGSAPSQWPAE